MKTYQYEDEIIAAQSLDNGKYDQFKDWNGDKGIQVDEYSNGKGVVGYCIREFKEENGKKYMSVTDYGNGGFSTKGFIEVGKED